MVTIGAHHHRWNLSRRPPGWPDPPGMTPVRRDFGVADLAAVIAGSGIDRTVLVQRDGQGRRPL